MRCAPRRSFIASIPENGRRECNVLIPDALALVPPQFQRRHKHAEHAIREVAVKIFKEDAPPFWIRRSTPGHSVQYGRFA